jgi:hypothetical protein
MEQERKIDVMIAEACHEEYVDIILDTKPPPKCAEPVSPSVHMNTLPKR